MKMQQKRNNPSPPLLSIFALILLCSSTLDAFSISFSFSFSKIWTINPMPGTNITTTTTTAAAETVAPTSAAAAQSVGFVSSGPVPSPIPTTTMPPPPMTTTTTTTMAPMTAAPTTTAGQPVGTASGSSSSSGLSAAEQVILNCHNAYRSTLAKGTAKSKAGTLPAGANILQLNYSSTVATVANAWANKCTMQHSGGQYGESLYMSSDASLTPAQAMQQACDAWWSELANSNMGSNLQFTMATYNSGIGHWTQMAWASTGSLGCAVASCPNSQWKTYVVCNYDPAGNFLDENIYQAGTACSACPSGTSCNSSNGLCVPA